MEWSISGGGVGMFGIVNKQMIGVLITLITKRLDWLPCLLFTRSKTPSTKRHLERAFVLIKVSLWIKFSSGF
tara:strand:- start:17 stop:232 length:216 start_codon:yes stop_codon:yes gene_type:complete